MLKVLFILILTIVFGGLPIAAQEPQVLELYRKGYENVQKNNLNAAFELFNEVIKLDSSFQQAYTARGNVNLRLRRYDAAITDYSIALALNPRSAGNYINLSSAYSGKNEFEKSLEYLKRAEEIDPNFPQIYAARGNVYRQMKEYKLAVESFTKAIEIKPYSYLYVGRCLANYDFEKYESAVEDCSESVVKNPKDFMGHYYRGLARIKLEQKALATTDLRRALELNPNHIGVKQSLEKLLKENKY